MKKIMISFKDRKNLILVFCLMLICVFALTIAYAALNAVLTISGSAQVSAANWDIYLSNPKVKSGSVNTNAPTISGNTLSFNTTLNMPGDFYEFAVDVVNDGSIDAVVQNVVKNPELTAEQAKFLKYEITYQNGDDITTNKLLEKKTFQTIVVRLEYRKDLNNSDLPRNMLELDLSLTFECVQIDDTVSNNPEFSFEFLSGNVNTVGSEVCVNSECFYVIGNNGSSVILLAKYNLYVGNSVTSVSGELYDEEAEIVELSNATGLQSVNSLGAVFNSSGTYSSFPWIGTVAFSKGPYWSVVNGDEIGYVYNDKIIVYNYIENYKIYLQSLGVNIENSRLISYEELISLGCTKTGWTCKNAPSWLYQTSFWSGSYEENDDIFYVLSNASFGSYGLYFNYIFGVRPVLEISIEEF